MMPSRSRRLLLLSGFLVTVCLYLVYSSSSSSDSLRDLVRHRPQQPAAPSAAAPSAAAAPVLLVDTAKTPPKNLHVAIVNAQRYHFEVVMPLLHTFGHQRDIGNLELIAADEHANRFGALRFLQKMIAPALGPLKVRSIPSVGPKSGWKPDVMVMTTCIHDVDQRSEIGNTVDRVLTENPDSTVICVLHMVQEWQNASSGHRKFVQKWAPQGRMKFLVLSHHVRDDLAQSLKKWEMPEAEILPVFVPVFPVEDKDIGFDPSQPQQKSIAIPGKYEPWRRSYGPILKDFSKHSSALKSDSASLELVGFGDHPGPITSDIKDLIHFHDGLDFDQYWATLRKSLAIAPAFATDMYLKRQASSSVPTALIVGVPLICGTDVLKAYAYLTPDDVWLLQPDESVVDGFRRVLKLGPAAWAEKRKAVETRRVAFQDENIRWVGEYLGAKISKSGVAAESEKAGTTAVPAT